jgi:predicted Zn-dependent protease
LNVQAPGVTLPAGLALSMRGRGPDHRRFLEEFGAAMAPFRAGDYAAAETKLASLASRYPDRDAAHFYLGIVRLFAGRPADAIEPLGAARSSDTYGDAAMWFSAVALERSGDHEAADRLLTVLCGRDGPYRASACDAQQPAPPAPRDAPR